jgi:hypothetical protein
MELNEQDIALFDAFIKKTLSKEETDSFEQNLAQDPELQAKFNSYKLNVNLIQIAAKERLKIAIKKKGEIKYFGNLWGKKGAIAYAAIFVLFGIGFWFVEVKLKPKSKDTISYVNEENEQLKDKNNPIITTPKSSYNPSDTEKDETLEETEDDTLNLDKDPSFVQVIEDEIDSDIEETESNEIPNQDLAPPPPEAQSSLRDDTNNQHILSSKLLLDTLISVVKDYQKEGESLKEVYGVRNIAVSYFQSPLNSKVYKYTPQNKTKSKQHDELQIYGLQALHSNHFKIIRNNLYMLCNGKLYVFVYNSQDYLPLKLEKDPSIITEFNSKDED